MGTRIEDDILDDAAATNSHGAGVAWFDTATTMIKWKKGLDREEVKAVLNGLPPKTPHVIHFRIATVGGVSDDLTHPFSIDERASVDVEGEANAVLFHNGGVSNWKELLFHAYIRSGMKVPEPPWSDTRAMAILCHVHGPNILSLIESGSRFLVFDAKADISRRMLKWGMWNDYKTFCFSNRSSKAFHSPVTTPRTVGSTDGYGFRDRRRSFNAMDKEGKIKKFKAPSNYEVWKKFSDDGVSLVAANEEALDAAMTAPINIEVTPSD